MFAYFHMFGTCLALVWLSGLGCTAERQSGASNTSSIHADVASPESSSPAEQPAGGAEQETSAVSPADGEGREESVAETLEGRWAARFARSTVLIDLETSNGSLSGTVREPGKMPVPIQIGIVTADGFLFETRGGGRCIWIARPADGVLSGRREQVGNGFVERFDGYRAGNLPTF